MRYVPFLFLVLTTALSSCENCGPSAEPTANVTFYSQTATQLDTVYAIGARSAMPRQPYLSKGGSTNFQLQLPINLTADSTRYVVQFSGRRDTVTVFYQRKTNYRNRKCGYVLDLYPPINEPQARTTRGKINYVGYDQNRDGGFLRGGPTNTGVYLAVQL